MLIFLDVGIVATTPFYIGSYACGPEPEVWAGMGSAPQPESGQRLGRVLGLGRDRYLVDIEPDFMTGSETKPW